MKLKNLIINKKRILSLALAFGFSLCGGKAISEIISYNTEATLKTGQKIKLYFTTGNRDEDYSYISFDNQVGYMQNIYINLENLIVDNNFLEVNMDTVIKIDNVDVYQNPNTNNKIGMLKKGDIVHVTAKTNDGWCVITKANEITGFISSDALMEKVWMGKLNANNVNVRYSPTTKKNNIIGFADITDSFLIIAKENDWYKVNYLGQIGYIYGKYIDEKYVNENDLKIQKLAYLIYDTPLFKDTNGTFLSYLPKYQNISILSEENNYYKVIVDGCVGYIEKYCIKELTNTFVLVDLSRQIVKVYSGNQEVYRAHMISGRESMQTEIGCFKIGHKLRNYQLTPENRVNYWMQYNKNIGLHDAYWQSNKNFQDVANKAYERFSKGKGVTYPYKHGSHGCNNLQDIDAAIIYDLINIGDNVLVIGPNNLINDHVLSIVNNSYSVANYFNENNLKYIKVKKLV